jgi:hypothetical protein
LARERGASRGQPLAGLARNHHVPLQEWKAAQLKLRALVAAAGEELSACKAVADAKTDLDVEQLEQAAFDEIGARLAE